MKQPFPASDRVEQGLLVGECKWSSNPVGMDILQDLIRKSELLQPKRSWEGITYLLFSKSGFTPAVEEQASIEKNIRLISVEECLF